MDESKSNLREGIFDPPAAKDLTEAYEKAEQLMGLMAGNASNVDREKVARLIIEEARTGETQPDLVSRAALAKALIEQKSTPSAVGETEPKAQMPASVRAEPAVTFPAGPHAAPEHTNEHATPGAGALPSLQSGDDVDPGAG